MDDDVVCPEHAALISNIVQDEDTASEELPSAASSRGGNALEKGDADICRAFLLECKNHVAIHGRTTVQVLPLDLVP